MEQFVEYVAKSLVDNKDAVKVSTSTEQDGTIVVHLTVAGEDLGKVIGKQGKIANAIRTVARAISKKENSGKVIVKIND